MTSSYSRRDVLAAVGAAGTAGLAGCLGNSGGLPGGSGGTVSGGIQEDLGVPCSDTDGDVELDGGRLPTEFAAAEATPKTDYDDGEIPLREEPLYLGHDRSTLADGDQSGGVGHDGIPSIDTPRFLPADEASMPACERVFGVELNGDVRAYPQRILVSHEIVNDVVGGEPVAVTYCPLTGTTQGFYRGGVEFGVSGQLVNSNLIMWDRAFDVRWPQVVATAVEVGGQREDGEVAQGLIGQSLREFRAIWTTWERWTDRHPDTLVMSKNTGYARNYNRDPYGSYTPVSGHYAVGSGRRPNFPLLVDSGAIVEEKRVVMGARTAEGAIAFDKRTLIEESVLTGAIDGTALVAVADDELATGYVYRNPEGREIEREGDAYSVDGETAPAAELPLESVLTFDAMWFAWASYYPDTEQVGTIP
jgi:hypothetical protein